MESKRSPTIRKPNWMRDGQQYVRWLPFGKMALCHRGKLPFTHICACLRHCFQRVCRVPHGVVGDRTQLEVWYSVRMQGDSKFVGPHVNVATTKAGNDSQCDINLANASPA